MSVPDFFTDQPSTTTSLPNFFDDEPAVSLKAEAPNFFEPEPAKPVPWAMRSEDPNHPFKRTLREHPGKFLSSLGTGFMANLEAFIRGGRQPGEFEGVPSMGMPEDRPDASKQMAVDELRRKVYEGVDDEEIKDILEKGEILGGFLPAERAIFGAVAGVKKLAEFNKAIGNIAKSSGKSKLDVLGDLWKASKNFMKEKFKWPEGKAEAFERGDVTVLEPEEAKALVDQAKKMEIEIPVEPVKEPVKEIEAQKPPDFFQEIEVVSPKEPDVKEKSVKPQEPKSVEPAAKVEFPKNELQTSEDGTIKYRPAGVVGDYIRDPQVRKSLQEVLDYPVRYHHPRIGPDAYYESNFPISISEKYYNDADFKEILFEEAIHALQDIRGRKEQALAQQKTTPYEKQTSEISAKKFASWAIDLENKAVDEILEKEKLEREGKKEVKPESGYVRKPEPKTVEEKISHLTQKIKESDDHADALNTKLQESRERLKELKAKKPFPGARRGHEIEVALIQTHVDELMDGRNAEREYGKRLKQDLKDLKEKREGSQVRVPLGKRSTREPSPKLDPLRPVIGKKQAAKRSDIIKLFRKAFNDPIRLGKFRQRASGIHKVWERVTRLLKDNNVETAAHEIGHNLHTLLYGGDATTPKQQFANINKALRPYLDELKPLAAYEPYGMEGFAEFTRLYVTNPDVAKELAPKFYAKFENDLDAIYPELKNALLEARDYYDQYLQGTPQSRIRAQTDYAEDSSFLDSIIEWVKSNGFDKLKTQFLDDVFPAKRLVAEAFGIPLSEVENLKDPRNLYRSLRVLKGAIGKGDVFLLHETFDSDTLEKINGSLRDILRDLPDQTAYREFNDYLIARRVIEKSEQDIETGISYGDAIVVERQLREKYEPLAKRLDEYNDSLLKYARDSGLLSDEQYMAIKKNNLMYVPFQRVIEPEKGGVAATGGKLQAGKPIKRMKGSTRDIIAPIESVIKNTYAIIINSEKNRSAQVLAQLSDMKGVGKYVERVPTPMELKGKIFGQEVEERIAKNLMKAGMPELVVAKEINGRATYGLRGDIAEAIPDVITRFGPGTYPAGENIITVFQNGKPQYYEVSPEIYEMWTKGIAPYTAGLLTKILRMPARTLRAGAILNPKFVQKNFIRDTWGGFLFTKYGKDIKDPVGFFIDTLYSPLAMLGQSAKQGPLYVEWLKAGGGMSTMQSLDRDSVVKKLKEVRDGYSPHQIIKWLRKVAEISEEGNRLAEFGRALQVEGKTRLGMELAAFAARDLSIDFAKMGLQTKAINQIIPFFNATLQGTDKFFRTLFSDEDRNEFLARVTGFVVIPSLILAWLNEEDERVKEFYEEEKDFNFITFIGDTAIKIPVPFETGVLAHGLTQRMYKYFMEKDPTAFEGFMGSILSAMLPSGIPAFANPVIETMANKNFFTGARIIPASKEDLIAKYQYKNNTSLTARLIGRAMAYMLGEETRSKAASPAVIDHFINSWGGGLGRLIVNLSDMGLELAGKGDKIPKPGQSIVEKLGLDAFVARYPRANTRSIEKFYDNYQDASARMKSFKYAQKMSLETVEAQEQAYERFEKIYDYKTLQAAYKTMQRSQKAINNIWNDPDIPADTKKTMIDDLYKQQIQFCQVANEDIRRYRLVKED